MNRSRIQAGIAGMVLLSLANVAFAQEMAKLPYVQIAQLQKMQAELTAAFTNLHVSLRMIPTDVKIKPNEVDLFIASKQGRLPVKIAENGVFNIPMSRELDEENPWLITNQPRGTMKLDWMVGMKAGQITNAMTYKQLMQPVKDCEVVQTRMREAFAGAPKMNIIGLKLFYDIGIQEPMVIVAAKHGEQKYRADGGQITIPLDPVLLAQDPPVTLRQIPAKVEIISNQSAE